MTRDEIAQLVDLARAKGLQALEVSKDGVKFVLGPAPTAAPAAEPKRKAKSAERPLTPDQRLDRKLFGPLGIRKGGAE